jgi:hypothetical protein
MSSLAVLVVNPCLFTASHLQNIKLLLPKVAGHSQNRSNIDYLKGGVDGFSYFSILSEEF